LGVRVASFVFVGLVAFSIYSVDHLALNRLVWMPDGLPRRNITRTFLYG
jgi:hypothetical protein